MVLREVFFCLIYAVIFTIGEFILIAVLFVNQFTQLQNVNNYALFLVVNPIFIQVIDEGSFIIVQTFKKFIN